MDSLPKGFGVTAFNQEDARHLLTEGGYEVYFADSEATVDWTEIADISQLDQKHIVPNMGPVYFRGVWYPCLSLGFEKTKPSHS